jgi:hypothetical protein
MTTFFYTLFVLCAGYFVRVLQEPNLWDRIAPIVPNDDEDRFRYMGDDFEPEEELRDKEEVSLKCFEDRP